jgi:hypothetical protein
MISRPTAGLLIIGNITDFFVELFFYLADVSWPPRHIVLQDTSGGAALAAVEYFSSQFFFKLVYRLTQRRLRDIQLFGCLGEAALAGYGQHIY